jgi:hypothetical protein
MVKRLAIVLALMAGCVFISSALPISQSNLHLGMRYTEMVAQADAMVEKKFPEWYVEDIPFERNIDISPTLFASAYKTADGTFLITLYDLSLNLKTVEDLASVLLHEYVHVKIWNDLEKAIPEKECNDAIHEMTAYGAEVEQTRIQVSPMMRASTQIGYNMNYFMGIVSCPIDIMVDFPFPSGGWLGATEDWLDVTGDWLDE